MAIRVRGLNGTQQGLQIWHNKKQMIQKDETEPSTSAKGAHITDVLLLISMHRRIDTTQGL
jgi:hypothetical protein